MFNPGYLSASAVSDLLAVKEGEKDALRQALSDLQNELDQTKAKLELEIVRLKKVITDHNLTL